MYSKGLEDSLPVTLRAALNLAARHFYGSFEVPEGCKLEEVYQKLSDLKSPMGFILGLLSVPKKAGGSLLDCTFEGQDFVIRGMERDMEGEEEHFGSMSTRRGGG